MDNVLTAIERLDGWLERNDCKGYDPFDGLNAKLPRPLMRSSRAKVRSAAVSDIPQDDYINAVVKLDTELQPLALLLELQAIESAYYRNRSNPLRWAPRTLDLDIILFGSRTLDDSHLVIPHPEFVNRRFSVYGG